MNYQDFIRSLDLKARESNTPLFGTFELTPLCNLACGMCYVRLSTEQFRGRDLLSVDTWKDLMRQAFDAGMFEATLTGGECLTYPGFEDLFLFLQSLGCNITVMTNAVLLAERRLSFFRDHPPALIQATLYGCSEDSYERVTGSRVFGRVVENLRRVREAGLPLSVSVTPNSFLGEDVFDTLRLAHSLSEDVYVSSSLFTPADEPWRAGESSDLPDEFYARLLRLHSELQGLPLYEEVPLSSLPEPGGPSHSCEECGLTCGGGRSGFVLSWKGELKICSRLDVRADPLRDGFAEAWRRISEVANSWPRVPECYGCPYEDRCSPCAANFMRYAPPGQLPSGHCMRIKYWISKGILPVPACGTPGE